MRHQAWRRESGGSTPVLGTVTWRETYDLFHEALGDGRAPASFANSLKNTRDAFDAHLPSGRVGWLSPERHGPREEVMVGRILAKWGSKSEDELRDAVEAILAGSTGDEAVDPEEATLRTEGGMKVRTVRLYGLDALRQEIGIGEIAQLIERTARWVAPETFRLLPVWYPEHARRRPFYKANWSEPQMNKSRRTGVSVHKVEGNVFANQALTLALGLRKADRPNWSCCHLWGVDDPTFQQANDVVSDHRFYSCIGNMVLLPTPLKAFTDTMPEVKAMLRICAESLRLAVRP